MTVLQSLTGMSKHRSKVTSLHPFGVVTTFGVVTKSLLTRDRASTRSHRLLTTSLHTFCTTSTHSTEDSGAKNSAWNAGDMKASNTCERIREEPARTMGVVLSRGDYERCEQQCNIAASWR